MNTAISTQSEKGVVRSLKEIEASIHTKLKEMEEAIERTKQPFWGLIGDDLVEAERRFDTVSEFYAWANRQFGFSETTTRSYKKCATLIAPQNGARPQSWSDAMRSIGQSPRRAARGGIREWKEPVDDIVERARREAERIRDQELTRQEEREAERKLAYRLIDIGYKVLAKELHPDAGGSKEAMGRLHTVRDRLKAHA
jgi:hypothetical protein